MAVNEGKLILDGQAGTEERCHVHLRSNAVYGECKYTHRARTTGISPSVPWWPLLLPLAPFLVLSSLDIISLAVRENTFHCESTCKRSLGARFIAPPSPPTFRGPIAHPWGLCGCSVWRYAAVHRRRCAAGGNAAAA